MRISRRFLKTAPFILASIALILLSGCSNKEEQITKIERNAEDALFDGKLDEAIELLSKGIKKHKNSAKLHRAYGQALADNAKYAEAAEAIEKSILLEPENANLWVNVGEYSALAGNTPKAIEALDKYVKVNNDDFLAWKTLATLKSEVRDNQGAIDAALTWNKLRPSAKPALMLGDLFLASDNKAQARSWYAQAAAYVDESQAQEGLANLIQLEADTKQYLQAESRLKEYETRYGANSSNPRIESANELIDRWRDAQAELAKAGEELQSQRKELEAKKIAQEKAAEEKRKKEEAEKAAQELAEAESQKQAEIDKQYTINQKAPTPLFEEVKPTVAGETETVPDSQTTTATAPIEAQPDLETSLWNKLGENNKDPDSWFALAKIFSDRSDWFQAENCILEARRFDPLSEPIASEYLKIISHTQPKTYVINEAMKLAQLFPRNADIALTIAKQLRASNASPFRVTSAYRTFLQIASPRHEGYEEATKYVTTGN